MIIADAGPLIALARVRRLALIKDIFQEVLVPDVVATECTRQPASPGADSIQDALAAGLLTRTSVSNPTLDPTLVADLGPGEAAAIMLAHSRHCLVLLDDKLARETAVHLGVAIVGTGGLLIRGKRLGLIPSVKPILLELIHNRYRISQALMKEILSRSDE